MLADLFLTPSKKFGSFVGKAIAPPGLPFLVGLGSKPAIEARKDQSGFWPDFGISEAIQVANPAYDYFSDNQSAKGQESAFVVEPKISDKTYAASKLESLPLVLDTTGFINLVAPFPKIDLNTPTPTYDKGSPGHI